jgi:hypothetical protein
MNRPITTVAFVCMGLVLLAGWLATGTAAELYFSSDKNGEDRVTNIQEGDAIWIVVVDNDQNTDCDLRDKMSPDVKIIDPKTGAFIVWQDQNNGAATDRLEETGADTGVFVSMRPFQVGTRLDYGAGNVHLQTHVVDVPTNGLTSDFQWGHYEYVDNPSGAVDPDRHADDRGWFGVTGVGTHPGFNLGSMGAGFTPTRPDRGINATEYLIGRFENMDTLVGMYRDPNDGSDIAVAMAKIIDTEATISWNRKTFDDANSAATVTVIDPDENLSCHRVEYVPVFILVNPGSWNPVNANPPDGGDSPTNFCMLVRDGGVAGAAPNSAADNAFVANRPIRWYNIYNSHANAKPPIGYGNQDGLYYIEYPVAGDGNVTSFDTVQVGGITRVSFYAQETGSDTGVFELNLNSLLADLGFRSLDPRDVLVAYYLDPNDFDDFKLATAYIEEWQHSCTSFTDAMRAPQDVYWIGRDPVYVEVIDANANVDDCCPERVVVHICDPHGDDDAEWLVLDETGLSTGVFFTSSGYALWPAWDALGVGLTDSVGGWQLQLDNWRVEVFNEDDVYARYNDVHYEAPTAAPAKVTHDVSQGLAGLGDLDLFTSFPPRIQRARDPRDVSFALASIADTQVFASVNMVFLDARGNYVSEYQISDRVFIEVVDADQDEDQARRERIDAFWDGGQNFPFGPLPLNTFVCDFQPTETHPVNELFGDTNLLNDSPDPHASIVDGAAKIYVLNPRNGRWAGVDLLETGVDTGRFVSVICIDLASVYDDCGPTLGAVGGDTIVAVYQDPSNHSDSAWISIKVGIGGCGPSPGCASTTEFVDESGSEVASYTDADPVYVRVIDPSHAGAPLLAGALTVEGVPFDVFAVDGAAGTFMTGELGLQLTAGAPITATYTDPADSRDTSSDTIPILPSVLQITEFYAAPNPFDTMCRFGYTGTGVAAMMSVEVYDLAGKRVWSEARANVTEIVWDGTSGSPCRPVANGAYIYVIAATDGTATFTDDKTVFVRH